MPILTNPLEDNGTFRAPDNSDFGTTLGAEVGRTLGAGAASTFENLNTLFAYGADQLNLLDDTKLSARDANRLGADYGVTFEAPVGANYVGTILRQKQEQRDREMLQARLPDSFSASTALTLAEFGGMALDPVNLALAFVPVVGQARFAALAAKYGRTPARLMTGAIEGGVGTALLEPINFSAAQLRDDDYGLMDSFTNIAFGSVLGGGLHAGVGYAGDVIGRRLGAKAPQAPVDLEDMVSQAAARAQAKDMVGQPFREAREDYLAKASDPNAPALPEAPKPITTPEAIESLPYREKAGLMTQAVAQAASGRAVDVAPLMNNPAFSSASPLRARFYDGTGNAYEAKFQVIDAADLKAAEGDLQPRDRAGRITSDVQIAKGAAALDPQRLNDRSSNAAEGSPIVDKADNTVLSGNGRVAMIRRAYEQHPERAEAYRKMLQEVTGSRHEGMAMPVLVRRMETDMTPEQRQQFVVNAQRVQTMQLSGLEQAKIDAAVIREIDAPLESGDLTVRENRKFVNEFMKRLPAEDLNRMVTADGELSAEGVRRVQSALIANAYRENPNLLAKLLESTDEGAKSIAGALLDAAPYWGRMRDKAASGLVSPEADATADLLDAINRINNAREMGISYNEMVAQFDLLDPPTQATQAFISLLLKERGSSFALNTKKAVTRHLRAFTELADSTYGGPSLLGDAPTDGLDLLRTVREREVSAASREGRAVEMMAEVPETAGVRQANSGLNPAAASAAGSRLAPNVSEPMSSPGLASRQAEPSQMRPTAEPSSFSNTANTRPSLTAGPMMARDFDFISVFPYEGNVRQLSTDVKANMRMARKHEPYLLDQLNKIAEGLGDVKAQVRVKAQARLGEKVAQKGAQRITDYLAGRLVVDTVDDLEAIVQKFAAAKYRIVEKEVTLNSPGTEWGWRDAKLQVELEKGFTVEVQVVPKPLLEVSNGPGHLIYEKWRNVDFAKVSAEDIQARMADMLESRRLYDNAMMRFMTSRAATREIPVVGEVRAEVGDAQLSALRQRAFQGDTSILKLQDSLDGDLVLQQSDVAALDTLAAKAADDVEVLLAQDMERLSGLQLTEAERFQLAEADAMMQRVSNVQDAIKAAAGCILRG